MTGQQPLRVLVVDDSPLVRRTLQNLLAEEPEVQVVGTASDGLEALDKIRTLRPDVVTLDVIMPKLDGLKVLACVMRDTPVRVLMLSSLTREGAQETLQALELGAVDFIDKNALMLYGDRTRASRELMAKIRTVGAVKPERLLRRPGATDVVAKTDRDNGVVAAVKVAVAAARGLAASADLVVVGASTGGPPALQALIPSLPGDLPAGMVVVQHIPSGFTAPLADRLDSCSALTVREARDGEEIRPGLVLVAPAGRHLVFDKRGGRRVVALRSEPAGSLHRPSVDVTMGSAAQVCGRRSLGVLLTGMGSDGAQGMAAIRERGGWTIAESEESCIVYGMPRAAVELGAAAEVVPLPRIAERIVSALLRRPIPG